MTAGTLCEPGDSIVTAVSGGPDSMALMHVLARLADSLRITQIAAYVNHGLRPAEAQQEEELIATQARRLGIPWTITRVDVTAYARNEKKSLEHGARILRYQALEEIAQSRKISKIALAHTGDDQAEELLIRLIRGTGRKGLSGMEENRAGRYIRPFLSFSKKELLDYLRDREIPFLIDTSNEDRSILRNRVRLELIPFLADNFNSNIRETLLRTATLLREEESLLADLTESAARDAFADREDLAPGTFSEPGTPPPVHLRLDAVSAQHPAIRRRILETACWKMDFRPSFRIINRLDTLIQSPKKTGPAHLACGLRVKKDQTGKRLIFYYPQGRIAARGNLEIKAPEPAMGITITQPGAYPVESVAQILLLDRPSRSLEDILSGRSVGDFVDFSLVTFPLTLRTPLPGDRFHPLGGPGSQKVSDFLGNLKLDDGKRKKTAVLLSASGEIIALPGLRIDHRFRVTAATKILLRIRWTEADRESA